MFRDYEEKKKATEKIHNERVMKGVDRVAVSSPDLTATLKGKHEEDCECTYCEPPDCCDPMYEQKKLKEVYESNKQESHTLHHLTQDQEAAFLQKCADVEATFKRLEHPKDVGESYDEARSSILKWTKKCDDLEEDKRMEEVNKAAEILADEIVRERTENPVRGMMIVYVDIGQLTSSKGDTLLESTKDKYLPIMRRLPMDWETMYVPTRHGGTRVEMMKLSEEVPGVKNAERRKPKRWKRAATRATAKPRRKTEEAFEEGQEEEV